MPELLSLVSGAVAGLALGQAAWALSRHFVAGYRSQQVGPAPDTARPGPAHAMPGQAGPQRAACAVDGGSISPGTGLVLTAMTLLGGYVGWQASSLAVAACALVITALLLALALVDFQTRRLPNLLVLALLGCAVAQALWLGDPTLAMAALGMGVALAVFGVIWLLGRGALGLGDVKLVAALGALLGYPAVLIGLFAGVLAGGLAALLLLTGRAGRKDPFAYGPYLALGAWLVYTRVLGLWPG